ncbi:MAG: glycoside hydrolase family 57 protein [archaeon]
MVKVCIYFQVHQPRRMKRFSVFDIGKDKDYFLDEHNKEIMERVAKKCYLPGNKVLLKLIKETKGAFKVAFSITGTAIEQFKRYAPEVLESFKELAKCPEVEFLGETYFHSLAWLYSKKEFEEQVLMHKRLMKETFGRVPTIFRNTELIYTNALADDVGRLGFKGILAEGADHLLGWRSPNYIYQTNNEKPIKLLLKNYRLSDDIAFRFSNHGWNEYPLTADKYTKWVNAVNGNGTNINLFMDYETIGEHQWASTGIFRFFSEWPRQVLSNPDNSFVLPSDLAKMDATDSVDVPGLVSWADLERDLSAWLGNEMQQSALKEIYAIEEMVIKSKDDKLIKQWRELQTSDHFYYMCTKYFADGDVHKYFNPYDSPYESFIAFMNILNDIILRLKEQQIRDEVAHEALVKGGPFVSHSPSTLLDGGGSNG